VGYYMRGDYYRRGDLFGSILGGIGKVAGGFLTGGPVGAAAGVVSAFSQPKPKSSGITIPTFGGFNPFGGKGVGFPGFGPLGGVGPGGKHGKRPKKGEPGWKPRRMHVTNPKALRRAIRRAQGFEKLAMRVLSFSRPHGRPKGHAYFKRSKRR